MTAPTTTPSEDERFALLARLHGHRCPMSILGVRLGSAARERLRGDGGRLQARFHHRTCALDGIQLATGCTLGNGTIEVRPEGAHQLTLWVQESGESVTVRLTEEALRRGRAYASLRERAGTLPPDSRERIAVEERMEHLLRELERAPAEVLVTSDPGAP